MSTAPIPSLFGGGQPPTMTGGMTAARPSVAAISEPRTLMDLLYPGFYMVFLLRNGYMPSDEATFRERVHSLMTQVDRGAKKLGIESEDAYQAKFAFAALLDEIVLMSSMKIRDGWERKPLQLEMFGEQMAGEKFFEMLEKLRGEGARRLQVLEVFHMCLLLGFQGLYALEGTEKLGYLTGRLGDEIVHLQGRRAPFAPHWAPPDQIVNKLRAEVPLWVMGAVFALIGLGAFLGLRTYLQSATESNLARYNEIVQLAPQAAWVSITLP